MLEGPGLSYDGTGDSADKAGVCEELRRSVRVLVCRGSVSAMT